MNTFPRPDIDELTESNIDKEIIYQITDWFVPETDKNKDEYEKLDKYCIYIYGTNSENITICTKVINFQPFFYVKPPPSWEKLDTKQFIGKVRELDNKLREDTYTNKIKGKSYTNKIISRQYLSHFEKLKIIYKKDFWGFTNNKEFRFIKVIVNSLRMFNNLKYYFQSEEPIKEGFKLYESNIDPFLRFIHIKNIKPCGWIKVNNYNLEDAPDTICNYNITADWNDIEAIDYNKTVPLLIASFDIECSSSHGDFPVPIKNYKKLAQDLCYISKINYDDSNLLNYIYQAFENDVIINNNHNAIIHRLYAKSQLTNDMKEKLKLIEQSLRLILNKVKSVEVNDDADDDDEDDEEDTKGRKLTNKEYNEIEDALNKKLSEVLPKLEGDKIIQIGITVHKYGSDEIIYRRIITLNDCDDFENTDVVCCKTEAELLLSWKRFMSKLNADIIIGYNIWGFDIEYIWDRTKELGINDRFRLGLGRIRNRYCNLVEQKLSSSALGDNTFKLFDIDGVVCVDLLKVMQKDFKLDSYKLDNVAAIYIKENKDDLKPKEIFEKFKGTSADRCVIAKYCIQDCILVNKLLHKLKIIENNIGMGNVCLVPLNFLFRRGQGIKIFSLIANECMKRNYLIPVIKNYISDEDNTEGYEGAIVLEPKEGIYLDDPIVVFDYGSLYPSSMICRNLSHDTYIMDDKYRDIKDDNVEIIKVSYDLYEGIGDKKVKNGVKDCYFAKYKDGKKGIIPDILDMLLNERKNTRKKIEYITIVKNDDTFAKGYPEETENSIILTDVDLNTKTEILKADIKENKPTYSKFECNIFDALQSAYKVTANSLYGQIGAKTSAVYLKDIAACTTSTGREMIMLAKNFVEHNYDADVIYGDSVMPYTPITYKIGEKLFVSTFEKINGEWKEYNNFKPHDIDRFAKEQLTDLNMKVWTHKGWATVRKIIRHKTIKKIYRVLTHTGLVDVTEDHSLLNGNCEIIKPCDCIVGQELLHSKPEIINNMKNDLSEEQAYLYGVFMGDGLCDINKKEWSITNDNKELLNRCKEIFEKLENITCTIIDENKLIPDVITYELIIKYKMNCYDADDIKIALNIHNKEAFKKGLLDSTNGLIVDNQLTAQSIMILFDYNMRIDLHDNIYYKLTMDETNDNKIRKIDVLYENYNGYVYDIETEEGVFHGGIGNIILKNTDSIFCKFRNKDKNNNDVYGKEALPFAIENGLNVEAKIKKHLPYPQKLNYEKCLYPFILFTKKRYVGNLYERDVNRYVQKSMGIVLKRRDNANIVKKVFGGVIDIILNNQDLELSIKFLREELQDLVNGKTDLKDLILSKTLRGFYKDPSKIAHKVLADRIAVRDPGNKPAVNDRIQYVYIKVKDAKLQGEKIETPEYIVENRLVPDYLHYITNQIMKPVLQLYVLCLKDLAEYKEGVDYWDKIEEELKQKEMYIDDKRRKNRLDNLKLRKVQELLFDEFIMKLQEPKEKVVRKKKEEVKPVAKKEEVKPVAKVEIIDNDKILLGEIKIIESKVKKSIGYKVKITKDDKIIYSEEKENSEETMTKDKILRMILIDVYNKHKTNIIKMKINCKPFIKDYRILLAKYNELTAMKDINKNDVGIRTTINLITKNKDLIEIKDNIIIID
jgi:DNA polymerase elongation subunit (family B)